LRDDAIIRRFDDGETAAAFIIEVDGRHFVATKGVAAILELTRHVRTPAALARAMFERFGKQFSESEIDAALRTRMPAAFFRAGERADQRGPLPWRLRVLSAAALEPLLRVTSALFRTPIALGLILAFLVLDVLVTTQVWREGIASASNASLPGACALVLAGVVIHELGHLSACHRFGASHGGIGAGLYWYMPVLYAEVHGAWMLPRLQRTAVDVAGIYFQCVFLELIAALWLARPSGTLLIALWTSHFLVLNTLNPVLKYDGYWLLSDLSGRYNLHRRVRRIARQYWLALLRRPQSAWPAPRDRRLLGLFTTLAGAYFAYLLHFLAHNLAYTASRIDLEQPIGPVAAGIAGFALMMAVALGVSVTMSHGIARVMVTQCAEHADQPRVGA
jgi:putative peptide zinc metalloprotease protein